MVPDLNFYLSLLIAMYYRGPEKNMLLPGYTGLDLVDLYSEFISAVTWYRMYCVTKQGTNREDYLKGYNTIKNAYSEIGDFLEYFPDRSQAHVFDDVLEKIGPIIRSKKFAKDSVEQIGTILYEFEVEYEQSFRHFIIKHWALRGVKNLYPAELYSDIIRLLSTGEYDAAIVAAFKYLDKHLQSILGVSPYEYYGESLINYAFAPQQGKFQLSTNDNEQKGLRNFFSGANAIFRNPVAHRGLFKGKNAMLSGQGEVMASSIIIMVGMMSRISITLYKQKIDPVLKNVLKKIATSQNWDTKISKIEYTMSTDTWWAVGHVAKGDRRTIQNHKIRILFCDDVKGYCFKLFTNEDVANTVVENLVSTLSKVTPLRILINPTN